MARYDTNVRRAFSSQCTLIDRKEHCSADPEKLATIGRAQGHQIRVWRNGNGAVALYTVSEVREETPGTIIRMARAARVAIAPHGGAIERWTEQQAERVASQLACKGVSCWRCRGFSQVGEAFEQWQTTSAAINPASFPLLGSIIQRGFTYAVAFHGFSENDILIGGGAGDALKQEIQTAIQSTAAGSCIEVRIATASDNFNGDDPENIVNRLAHGNGIQIEQCREARDDYWAEIADAVASVYNSKIECLGTAEY